MRLQLVGNYTIEEFEKAIATVLDSLKSNKINSVQHINIYLRTCVDGREVKLTDDGKEIEHLRFDFARSRPISKLGVDVSVVKPLKIDFSEKDEDE